MDFVAAMELRVRADQAKAALTATKGAVVDLGAASKTASVQAALIGPALTGAGAKAAPAMAAVTAEAKVLGAEMRRVSAATTAVGTRSFAAGGGARMLGQQLSQVALQGAVTGNYLGALAVQLPDIALGFGGLAIAASIVATIAIPALINVFSQSEEKAKDVDAAIGDLSQSLSRYDEFVVRSTATTAELKEKFGSFAAEIRGFSEFMQGVSLDTVLKDMDAAIAPLKGNLVGVVEAMRRVDEAEAAIAARRSAAANGTGGQEAVRSATERLGMLKDIATETAAELGLLPEQVRQLVAALDGLDAAVGAVEIRDQAAGVLALLKQWYPAGAGLTPALITTVDYLEKIMTQSAETAATLEAAAGSGVLVADAMALAASFIDSATGRAEGLAGAIARAAANAWEVARGAAAAAQANARLEALRFENSPGGQALEKYGARGSAPDQPRGLDGQPITRATSGGGRGGGGGGGGGGGATGAASASLASLQAQSQAALAALDTAIAAINEKVKLGLLSTAEGSEAVARAKETAATAIAGLIPQLEKLGPASGKVIDQLRATVGGFVADIGVAGSDMSEKLSNNFETSFAAFITGAKDGKTAMADFGTFVLAELARIASQKFTSSVISPLLDSVLGSIFPSAKGNVISGPGISAYSNSIVDRPTFFPMAKGATGLMGEAGPEAVVPLARGPGGVLGIRGFGAGGGGGDVIVNVQNNGPQTTARATQRQQGGTSVIDVVIDQIRDRIAGDIAQGNGPVPGAMQSAFGLSRVGS